MKALRYIAISVGNLILFLAVFFGINGLFNIYVFNSAGQTAFLVSAVVVTILFTTILGLIDRNK